MPSEIFRRHPLNDPFSTLLTAEMGNEPGNLLLFVWSLVG